MMQKSLVFCGILAALSACGGNNLGENPAVEPAPPPPSLLPPLLGPGATIEEAQIEYDAIRSTVLNIQTVEGDTTFANLPFGEITYRGIITGFGDSGIPEDGDRPPIVRIYADFDLTIDLANSTNFTGTLTNFVTDVPNFENPTGSVEIVGSIANVGGRANVYIDNSGEGVGTLDGTEGIGVLEGNGVTAVYDVEAGGMFVGVEGTAIIGNNSGRLIWTEGPNAGKSTGSFGQFFLESE